MYVLAGFELIPTLMTQLPQFGQINLFQSIVFILGIKVTTDYKSEGLVAELNMEVKLYCVACFHPK